MHKHQLLVLVLVFLLLRPLLLCPLLLLLLGHLDATWHSGGWCHLLHACHCTCRCTCSWLGVAHVQLLHGGAALLPLCPGACPPVDGFHVHLLLAVDCDKLIIPQHHCFWWLAGGRLLCSRRPMVGVRRAGVEVSVTDRHSIRYMSACGA